VTNDLKILIFRNQGIGDLILISASIRSIRELHPDAHISVFVGNWSKPAVEGLPYVDEIISYPDPWIQNKNPFRILSLVWKLLRKKFDRVYIFHSHNLLHLLTLLAGIPERYGFSFKGTGKFLTKTTEWDPNSTRYIADNYLDIPRLAGFIGDDVSLDFPLSDDDETSAQNILNEHNLSPGKYYVIAPGGGINPRQNVFEKRWGADKFAALIDLMNDSEKAKIILVGAPAEQSICAEVARKTSHELLDLCGKTSFKTSAALVKHAKALVCNDSSIMHTAVAFQTPCVAVFGPSNPESLLPKSDLNRQVSAGVDCSPCYCNEIFTGCPHDLKCMKQLEPEKVLNVLKETLTVDRDNIPRWKNT